MVLLFAMSILPKTATAQTMLEATEHGDTAGVERLIVSGSPIDQANASGQTPLLLAVQNNHLAVRPA
jgi:ankyrin repeat protein